MRSSRRRASLALALSILAILALSACSGYRVTGGDDAASLALPEDARALFIKDVENRTVNVEVNHTLRTQVRDEFTRRGRVAWVDRESATAYLHLKVVSFTESAAVTDEDDETLKSSASISLEAWITRKSDGAELWRGRASHGESFISDRDAAEASVIEHAVRKLADQLAQNY